MLKYKHPDHFNTLGASHWRGKIYGGEEIGVRVGGDVIYHGLFGTGPVPDDLPQAGLA